MARIPLLADRRAELAVLVRRLREAAVGAQPEWVRLLVSLGVDVRAELRDPDPAVRLRAARACESDPAAREIILAALPHPSPAGTHRSELVAAAIRVASGFAEKRGDRLTDEQRALVRALVANPGLWDRMNGTVALVYRTAGLPFNRESCRRLAGCREDPGCSDPSV